MDYVRETKRDIDPVTFEVIRHRLWAINDEQATTGARMSGSPVVYEAHDFNTALMTADGDGLYVGIYLTRQAACMDLAVKSVIRDFADDIHRGDMFITNDPWSGVLHQNDFCMVSPIFHKGEIILWSGITMHEEDVGGPVPGNMSIGSSDIFSEAPIIPPIRVVEKDNIRKDIERLLRTNTRNPTMNDLNLKARIGCQRITRARVEELAEKYGADALLACQEKMASYVREVVSGRLREIPEGTWYERGFIDHDGIENKLYEIKLSATNRAGTLTLDFSGTSGQAPGPINCTKSGLIGGVMSAVLPMLCFDIPWCILGLKDIVSIVSKERTIHNALRPAPISLGSIESCWETGNVVARTLGEMLACSAKHNEETMANWAASTNNLVIHGGSFTGLWLGGGGGGGGARSTMDGVDTGGTINSPYVSRPNVETIENRYPLLELCRIQLPATSGPGKFRGGLGTLNVVVPYKTKITAIRYGHGANQPGSLGICGGFPSTIMPQLVIRNKSMKEILSKLNSPSDLLEEKVEVLPAKGIFDLGPNDAVIVMFPGGGGYSDPLLRDPGLVIEDIKRRLCDIHTAREMFGVVVEPTALTVKEAETNSLRKSIRENRIAEAKPLSGRTMSAKPACPKVFSMGESLEVCRDEGDLLIRCSVCGYLYGSAENDPRLVALMKEGPLSEISRLSRFAGMPEIVYRAFFCPGCGTSIGVELARNQESITAKIKLNLAFAAK